MASITKKYKHPLPDELWVEGVSGDVVGSWTYKGPSHINVVVDEFGQIAEIDETQLRDAFEGQHLHVVIDAKATPWAASFVEDYFNEEVTYEEQYEDIEMENGDIYQLVTNPRLADVFELYYNRENSEWYLEQILKPIEDKYKSDAEAKLLEYKTYYEKYAFDEDIDKAMEAYINALEKYIPTTQGIHTWKYINRPLVQQGDPPPKTPAKCQVAIQELIDKGL